MVRFFCGVFFVVCFLAAGQAGAATLAAGETGWTADGWKPLHAMGDKLNRQDFIKNLASYKKISEYDAELEWEATQEVLTKLFANGNGIAVRGWGEWKFVMVEARMVRNPQSGKLIKVPRNYKETWTISDALKDKMNTCIISPADCEL